MKHKGNERLFYFLAFITYLAMPTSARAEDQDDVSWIKSHLAKVYKTTASAKQVAPPVIPADLELLYHLDLLIRIDEEGRVDNLLPLFLEKTLGPPPPKLPQEIADEVLAGFRKINELKQVVVQKGAGTFLRDGRSGYRWGIMSIEDFKFLYESRIGSDKVYSPCKMAFNGKDIEINCDYKAVIDYVSFSYKYDAASKKWIPKYEKDSQELKIVNETERVLTELYKVDPFFNDAEMVRSHISKKMIQIREAAEKGSLSQAVEEAVTLVNLRNFHGKYGIQFRKSLGENPSDDDLLRFERRYGEMLGMTFGHCPKL